MSYPVGCSIISLPSNLALEDSKSWLSRLRIITSSSRRVLDLRGSNKLSDDPVMSDVVGAFFDLSRSASNFSKTPDLAVACGCC